MPLRLALTLAAVILFCALPWFAASAAGVPQISDDELSQALALGGSNRPQLEQALTWADGASAPLAHDAMRFLIANLPLVDLSVISARELQDHVRLAIQARGEFAYTKCYDDAIWAHYVLAPRVSQEPLSDWRPILHDQLAPLVADCQTIAEATKIIGEWYAAHARFEQTQTRDQNALATLKSGYGRCEELVILWLCACRAVGIPSRQSFCPYWAIMDNNHAWWVDFGDDGFWGGYDTGQPAPLVMSICYGLPDVVPQPDGSLRTVSGEAVLMLKRDPGARYCYINSTPQYRPTGQVSVSLPPDSGQPSPAGLLNPQTGKPYTLTVHVYNWGAYRGIVRLPFDESGRASLALGWGDFVLSCDAPTGPRNVLLHVAPGAAQTLDWAACAEAPAAILLSWPREL